MNQLVDKPTEVASYVRTIPSRVASQGVELTDSGLNNSIRVVAGPGAGKSRWAGRLMLWQRLIRGEPALCIDPTRGVVANLFDKICRQPEPVQELLWPRIRYVDMAATDYVVPMPLYQRHSEDETLLSIASRFLEVTKRLDPHLVTASVEGWNALYEVGAAAGMMAAALDMQITEVDNMVRHPKQWMKRLKAAYRRNPEELQKAYDIFQDLLDIHNPVLRKRRTGSFLIKLFPFLADLTMKAMFAADRPGLDLDDEMAKGHLVIYDFQGEHDPVRRRMKLLATFLDHVDFAKRRGVAGRENPVLYVIDEITQLLGQDPLAQSMMADDFNELTTVVARNYGFPTCLMHQNLSQIDERTQVSLSQIGTQVIGWIQEPADRRRLAEQFFRYDPHAVRKEEPVWMSVEKGSGRDLYHVPEIIDYKSTEYGLEEQIQLLAERFGKLGRFCFLVRTAAREGELSPQLVPMSIETLDMGQYPNSEMVAEVRRRLRKRDGVPITTLLEKIAARGQGQLTVQPNRDQPRKPKTEDDTIEKELPSHGPATTDNLPEPEPGASDVEGAVGEDDADWKDELWGKR